MSHRTNPFRPGSIAAPGIFSGRYDEIMALENALRQTATGNPQHFLVRGERGIGKSSLLFSLELVAKGELDGLRDDKFSYLVVSLALDKHTTFADLVRRIGKGLEGELARFHKAREALKDAWQIIKRLEAFGLKYADTSAPAAAQDEALDGIVRLATEATHELSEQINGILILIDEADRPPVSADLGLFLKHLSERLTRARCSKVLIGLAGLPGVIEKLRKSHESSPRIFNIMSLDPLTPDERVEVVTRGLTHSKAVNGVDTRIEPDAEAWIATFSEGYPHFIQQFAYSAFEADTDDSITVADVITGAMSENGAFRQLGLKYFEELYFDQIGAEEYRAVLRAMAETLDGWVTKDELRNKTGLKPYTVNNAVTALKKRNIIIAKPGQQGVYRLPTKSFAVWIRGFTQTSTPEERPA